MKEKSVIVDKQQNFWHLASIQIASLGLPGIFVGGELANKYGAGTTLISICVGNLILWFIALTVTSMAYRERNNAIENIKQYLGRNGSRLATFILIIAFLAWYLLQLKASTSAINSIFENYPKIQKYINIRFGSFLGLLIALISMGGIRTIKWICIYALPILFIFPIYAFFVSSEIIIFKNTWGFSIIGITLTMTQNLAGIINLPTFFRHSRSKADSFLALTLMTIVVILFQIIGIFLKISTPSDFSFESHFVSTSLIYATLSIIFVLLSTICVNLVNIYFSSSAWELIFPHRWNPKEYAIVGLFGTIGYAFLQAYSPMQLIEDIALNWISNLAIVLLLAFLVKKMANHRPRPQEKFVSDFCWIAGSSVATIIQFYNRTNLPLALFTGMIITIITFLVYLFIEETIWSIRKKIN